MNTKSFTGLKGFKFAVVGSEDVVEVEDLKGLQEISVSKEQSIEKAYADNGVVEMAVSNGIVELSSTFHHIPLEQRTTLFGLTTDADGLSYVGNNAIPPYVNVMFEKTKEDGAVEYVGLLNGKFLYPEDEGQTKGEDVEFGQMESSAEFMGSEVEGLEGVQTIILGLDEKGETKARDSIYMKLFGKAHPDATPVTP